MTESMRPDRINNTRLNVDLGERLAGDVETLRRLIQDSLAYRHRVSLGDVVRLALDALHLSLLKDLARQRPLSLLEAQTYMQITSDFLEERSCPAWLIDLYSVDGLPCVTDTPEEAAQAGRRKPRKPNRPKEG